MINYENKIYKTRRIFNTKFIFRKNEDYGRIGKYGMLRLHFIAKNKKAFYMSLLMKNKLTYHLVSVSQTYDELYKSLMESYIKNDERLSKENKNLDSL